MAGEGGGLECKFKAPGHGDFPRELRFIFVQMLFSLTAAEVARQLAEMALNPPAVPWEKLLPAYAQLVLGGLLVVTSWVGWSSSTASRQVEPAVSAFGAPFLVLLTDVVLVILYFLLVRGAEVPKDGKVPPPSAATESTIIMLVFALYLFWDLLTKAVSRPEGARPTFLARLSHSPMLERGWCISGGCLVLAVGAWYLLGATSSVIGVVLVDGALLASPASRGVHGWGKGFAARTRVRPMTALREESLVNDKLTAAYQALDDFLGAPGQVATRRAAPAAMRGAAKRAGPAPSRKAKAGDRRDRVLVEEDGLYFRVVAPAGSAPSTRTTRRTDERAQKAAAAFRRAFGTVWRRIGGAERQALLHYWRGRGDDGPPAYAGPSPHARPLIQITDGEPRTEGTPCCDAFGAEFTFPLSLAVEHPDRLPLEIARALAVAWRYATRRHWRLVVEMIEDPPSRRPTRPFGASENWPNC